MLNIITFCYSAIITLRNNSKYAIIIIIFITIHLDLEPRKEGGSSQQLSSIHYLTAAQDGPQRVDHR